MNQAEVVLVIGATGSILKHLILNLQRVVDELSLGLVGDIEKVELKCEFLKDSFLNDVGFITMMWVLLKDSFLNLGSCPVMTQFLQNTTEMCQNGFRSVFIYRSIMSFDTK